MYRRKRYRAKSLDVIRRDIKTARLEFPGVGRVFLCDGDALGLAQDDLVAILQAIRSDLPDVIRVSTYASAKSIANKTDAELTELRGLNLKLFHTGLESGDDITLARM